MSEKPNRELCYAEAKEMGFSLIKVERKHVLVYKGEHVATEILKSWSDPDDDYNYYDCCEVYVLGAKVGVRARLCQVGADRPGLSWCGYYAFCVGTLDGDKFVKNEEEERDVVFE